MFALAASATTARAAMATPPRVAAAPRARRAAIVPAPVRSRRHGIAPRGASRRVVRVDALPFGFGKKDPAEEEPEEEEEEEDAVVDGNPFASIGGRVLGAVADAEEKASAAGNPFASFMSRDEPSEPEEEEGEEEEEETEDKGPAFGNPFASFGSLGKSINLSQTIDLDYGDDEEEEEDEIEEEEAPAIGNPFAGIASGMLARSRAAVKRTSRSAPPEPEPEPEKKQMGNWERTLKEGIKDGDIPTWTLDPEPVRGASLRPLRLRTDDVVVVGRDRGPGIDYAAKVGCVSGVHCQFEMEGQRLYVTDLGSTNGTYVDGQELRKNNRFRVFNGQIVRLGAENMNGEPFVVFDAKLTGANEMDRNSEYGQVQALVEALGGPQVVVNFLFINVAFQLGFYAITLLQTN